VPQPPHSDSCGACGEGSRAGCKMGGRWWTCLVERSTCAGVVLQVTLRSSGRMHVCIILVVDISDRIGLFTWTCCVRSLQHTLNGRGYLSGSVRLNATRGHTGRSIRYGPHGASSRCTGVDDQSTKTSETCITPEILRRQNHLQTSRPSDLCSPSIHSPDPSLVPLPPALARIRIPFHSIPRARTKQA
jgi:hypothetical protein